MTAYRNAMRRYVSFSGRTSHDEFWRAQIVFLPLFLIAFNVFGPPFVYTNRMGGHSVWPLLFFVLIVLPHVVPWAALMVRRLHDMDFRGWWALISLVPFVLVVIPLGVLILLVWSYLRGTPGPNRFGPDPFDQTATFARRTSSPASPIASAPIPSQPAQRDLIAEIERLVQLRAAGSLSETEFEVMKAQVIGGSGRA